METIKIKPLGDRIVVEPKAQEEKTAAGIIIPDSTKERPFEGVVLAVGAGTKDIEMELTVGDKVLYGKYAGTEVTHEGETYLVMKQGDVFAVLL